jgi:hypothetical protein
LPNGFYYLEITGNGPIERKQILIRH